MKIRNVASILAATGAGAALTRVPWPTAEQAAHGLARFAADAMRGVDALRFEGALQIERGRAALDAASLTDLGLSSDAAWALGTGAAALLVFAITLLVGWRRRRAAAAGTPITPRGARRAVADARRGSRAAMVGTDALVRLGQARLLAANGRLSADVARESALSRDAVELMLRTPPRPDAISGRGAWGGRSFRGRRGRAARAAHWPFAFK